MTDLMIVGEAWGEQERLEGRPFVGPAGQILNSMLRSAGVDRRDCYLTNVFNFQPPDNKLESLSGPKSESIPGWPRLGNKLWVHSRFEPELHRLWDEIEREQPNCILALGATPLWAICKRLGIKKYRGTPLPCYQGLRKVLPTYHPSAIARQWKLRPIAISDIAKARNESTFTELRRPSRHIWLEPTLEDLDVFFEKYIKPATRIAADIETKQGTITEIGFAPSPSRAIVVPFYRREGDPNYWPTLADERRAWDWVRKVLAHAPIDGQNFSYDLQYLWGRMGIAVPQIGDDTMILHHAMYPEMEKSLGFLGSIYTNEPTWKFMRTDHDNFKREDA